MTEKEFTEIVDKTKGIVLSTINRYLFYEHHDAIDDVSQEVYIRAYKSLSQGKFRYDSKLTTWLFVIARNESLRMNRKLDRKKTIFRKKKESEYNYKDVEKSNDMLTEYLPILEKGISRLSEKHRVVIALTLKGKSEKAIAEELNIAKGTVKSRLYRARRKLKSLLKNREVS